MPASSLTVVLGRAGSGKSRRLYECMAAHMQKGEPAVLLTAEQSTYEAEKALCTLCGGLVGGQVLSLTRFSQRVLSEQGVFLPYLSAQGRLMVVRKAALRRQQELTLFAPIAAGKGFARKIDELITRFKQSGVRPEQLKAAAEKLPEDSLLRGKLMDLFLLYEEVQAYLQDRYLTEGDLWTRAGECFSASALCRSHIYVDGIDLPSRQLFDFLEGLLGVCLSMTVALRADPWDPENALFAPDQRTKEKLMDIACRASVPFKTVSLSRREEGPASLAHMEAQLFADAPRPFLQEAQEVHLCACADRELEASLLGDRILSMTRNGYRYRDMAVLVTDKEGYIAPVLRAFRRRGIPVFYDAGRPVSGHGAMALLVSALRFCQSGDMEQALTLMKTGYTGVSREQGEIFENYVLRYGLYGSALGKPFSFGEVPEEAEQARQLLAEPLLALKQEQSGAASARERVQSVYDYLEKLSLRAQLQQRAEELLAQGDPQQALLHSQVWNVLCELLTQLYTILGEDPLPLKEFVSLVEEGAAGYTLGVLPGTADQVLLGDFARTRSPYIRTLFVLGCSEGLLPRDHPDDGLIDDGELELLRDGGLELWQNTEHLTEFDRLELYTALCKAREELYFSYAYTAGGQEIAPSPLIKELKELFPRCAREEVLSLKETPLYEEGGFDRLTETLRLFVQDGVVSADLGTLYGYFSQKSPYKEALPGLMESMAGRPPSLRLGRAMAREMYGTRPLLSASRLELFNKCPFAHYMRYGLLAKERRESGEQAADAGTFFHEALQRFLQRCREKGLALHTLGEEEAMAVVSEILPELIAMHNDGIFLRDDRLRAGLFLRIDMLKRCVLSLLRQVQAGTFTPEEGEFTFGPGQPCPAMKIPLKEGGSLPLYGRIDRLDVSPQEGLFRIVDYKMGDKKFDPAAMEAGLTLQLPLYLAAAGEKGAPAGMYYMPLYLPARKEGEERSHVLRGVTCEEEETLQATERGLAGKSGIIEGLRADDKGGYHGPLCSREELKRLLSRAVKKAGCTADTMLEGEASAAPYKESCAYCPHRAVCRFDLSIPGCRYKSLGRMTLSQLLSLTEEPSARGGKEEDHGLDN